MTLSSTQKSFLEAEPSVYQDSFSAANPTSYLYDRRGSKNSFASSSGRSYGTESRISDGFYTPTYITSSEFRASQSSHRRPSASLQRSQDQDQSISASPRSQRSFQTEKSGPVMPVRKPKSEVNLFPVDVEDEEAEEEAAAAAAAQTTHLPLAKSFSSRSSPLADLPVSPANATPNSQSDSVIGERSKDGYFLGSYNQSWEIEASPSAMPRKSESESEVVSPNMASFISVGELNSSNDAALPDRTSSSSPYDLNSRQNTSSGRAETQRNTRNPFIIPKRSTSRSGEIRTPTNPRLQNGRSETGENRSLDGAFTKIDRGFDSSVSLTSSQGSIKGGTTVTAGAFINSASVTENEIVSDNRKGAAAAYPTSLSSGVHLPNSIAFPAENDPNENEQEKNNYPLHSVNAFNLENNPTSLRRTSISKASIALQKLGNLKSNVFGGSTQRSDSFYRNFANASGKEEDFPITSSSPALALSGLPASYQVPMNEDIELKQEADGDSKKQYPPSSSRNLNGFIGIDRSISGSQSTDGSFAAVNHSTGLSSIKGRLRSLSGSLRRMSTKSEHNHREGAMSNSHEMPKDQSSGSPLIHAVLPPARQSALTIASLAAKKESSPPVLNADLSAASSDIQSEILRPEDAAMPFIASQRLLRPAASPGVQTGSRMSSPAETQTSSGWSVPISDVKDNYSTLRPTLDTVLGPSSSSSSVPNLNSVKRKPVPSLDPDVRPRTASPALNNNINDIPQALSVGKTPRLRNAMSSTALSSSTSNAKDHNASVPAVLVPSNFGPQRRSPAAASQFGPAYPRRRSSNASQNATNIIQTKSTNGEEESVSPMTKTKLLKEDVLDSRENQSSVDTVTQHAKMPRRGSTSSNRKPVPQTLNSISNNAKTEKANDAIGDTRSSIGGESHSMPIKSSTSPSANNFFNGYSLSASGSKTSVQPLSPRSPGAWQGYKHANVSVDSTGSPFVPNSRLHPSAEAQRPSIVSLSGSQSGFGAHSGSSQEHSSYPQSNLNPQKRVSRSSGTGLDSGIQTYLNEEDYQIIEDEPILTKDLNLLSIRHRVAPEFISTGTRWTYPHRPLSIRSKRMSSETLRDDAQSIHDSTFSTANGEQGEIGKKSLVLGSEKEQKKRKEAVEAREKELTIEALSKAEMAYAHIDIWTESRRGKWIVKCPAPDDAYFADQLPDISDPWMIPIDAKGIVRRKKLKSNIELSSTRTTIVCPDCREAAQLNIAHNCATCHGSERVEMVYTVQCVVRMAQFLPLKLPAALLLGTKQPHIKYIDAADPDHRTDILRDRALEGLQSSAARVIRVHNVQHGSRLLMGRVKITRIGLLTVSVHSSKNKAVRLFDVEDGPNGTINEVTQLASMPNGRTSVMSNGTNSNRASISRKGSSAGLSAEHIPLPDEMESVKSGKTNKSRGASSLFYSLSGVNSSNGRKKKNGFGNASSPNLIQSIHQNQNQDPIPALPNHQTNFDQFGRTHKRNNLSDSGAGGVLNGHDQMQSSLYTSNASKLNGKRSIKSLFRHH